MIQDITHLRTLESELAASDVRRKFLKEKGAWLKKRIDEGYSSELDQLWTIGGQFNDEDALIAKVDLLARTQRYELARYAGANPAGVPGGQNRNVRGRRWMRSSA